MFQGAVEAVEENRAREQKNEDRLLSIKTSAFENYLSNKKTRTGNSALVAAKLKNISKFLPEGSPLIDELAGADEIEQKQKYVGNKEYTTHTQIARPGIAIKLI